MDDETLVTTVATILAGAGVGAWRPAGPAIGAAEVGLYAGDLPPHPDQGVGLAVYSGTDPVTSVPLRFVQLRIRGTPGDPFSASRIAGAAFAALHDTYPRGGIARITRTSFAPLGTDTNGRPERTDNYLIVLDTPTEATP